MKNKTILFSAGLTFLFPSISFAQLTTGNGGPFALFLANIVKFINETVIPFIIAIGFLFFVWGMFKFFILGGADDDKKAQGRSLMIHATFAFVAIILLFGIVNLITSSSGLEGETLRNVPTVEIPTL